VTRPSTAKQSDLHLQYTLSKGDFHSSIDLRLPARGITALFGDSGSGKTTLLRCIAGLEKIPGGHVSFRGEHWQLQRTCIPPHLRPIAYVFQQANLFSHLNVEKNLRYGFNRVKLKHPAIRFDDAVCLLGIAPLLHRYPQQLSGGQQQRVAIARALLTSPQLLLMDEPLASLDDASKSEILPYLETLHEQLDVPILYVSHSVEEVVRIADYMVLLHKGKVQAQGPLNQLMTDPALPLSHLEEACAVIEGQVESHQAEFHLTHIATPCGSFAISQRPLAVSRPVRIKVLARDVSIALSLAEHSSISNSIEASIVSISEQKDPAQVLLTLNAKGVLLLSRITRRSLLTLNLQLQQQVYAQVKSVSLMRE